MQEFRSHAKQQNLELDVSTLEGYISASILIDILKKINGLITKEAIIAQAEQIKDYSLKGLELNFDEMTRELSKFLWLDTGKKKWHRMSV